MICRTLFLQDGDTPLHLAALHNKAAVAAVLLDHHSDVNATNKVSPQNDIGSFCYNIQTFIVAGTE